MTASFVARVCVLRSNVRMTCHAHSNESCHACECATPHLRMSHDRLSCSLRVCLEEQRVNDVCVVSLMHAASHIWMRHVIYECVMLHANHVCWSALKWALLSVQHRTSSPLAPTSQVCCSVLKCVVVRCSALQCVAVRFNEHSCAYQPCVLQFVAVCCKVSTLAPTSQVLCRVLQCVAGCCNVL